MAQALFLAVAAVEQLHARLKRAGNNFQEAQTARVGVKQRLEHVGRRALLFAHANGFAACQAEPAVGGGAGEVRANVLDKTLNALLDQGGSNENRNEQLLKDGFVEQAFQLFLRQLLFAVKVLHHKVLVGFGNQVTQLFACGFRGIQIIGGNVFDQFFVAVGEVARLHAQHVNNALEVGTFANGDSHGAQARTEARVKRCHGGVEVCVFTVNVVDEHGAGKAHVVCFFPQTRAHGLRTGYGVENKKRRLAYLHGEQRLANEIGLSGSVKNIDFVVAVINRSKGSGNGESTFNFFGIYVKIGFSVVCGSHARSASRHEQHGFRQ